VFQVKICGVTSPDDVRVVAAAGADAVGLNFVPGSPRQLDEATACELALAAGPGLIKVGVFAGASPEQILAVVRRVGLDAVQLHGHLVGEGPAVDPPASCGALGSVPVIRAVRLEGGEDGLAAARAWLVEAVRLGGRPVMALLDARVAAAEEGGRLGGRGETVDWSAVALAGPLPVPLALAGGLDPDNVAEAVRLSGVTAVDAASGVETAPGRKDPRRVRSFVEAARRALAR
jgi:phosphoribosylanthranilate isomerase